MSQLAVSTTSPITGAIFDNSSELRQICTLFHTAGPIIMEHVKTVVSLNRKLYEAGETLASELKISRSRLFALALEEFIRRRRSRRLLDRIRAAYEDPPDPSERALQRAMRRTHRRLIEGRG